MPTNTNYASLDVATPLATEEMKELFFWFAGIARKILPMHL